MKIIFSRELFSRESSIADVRQGPKYASKDGIICSKCILRSQEKSQVMILLSVVLTLNKCLLTFSEPCQTSKMERSAKIVNSFRTEVPII